MPAGPVGWIETATRRVPFFSQKLCGVLPLLLHLSPQVYFSGRARQAHSRPQLSTGENKKTTLRETPPLVDLTEVLQGQADEARARGHHINDLQGSAEKI